MTKLTRPVKRETAAFPDNRHNGHPICFTARPADNKGTDRIELWQKGKRTCYTVTFHQAFIVGAQNYADEQKAAKQQEREQRRAAKRY